MTNYEKIKQFSIEEMVIMLNNFDCIYCPAYNFCKKYFKTGKCSEIIKQWLEQEVEE